MNTQISKVLLIVILSAILGVSAGAAVGTFTFKTTGASDTVEAVDLVYPQRVPETNSVTTSSIADGSVTPAKLSGPIPVANGGTGATTAAAGLAALGGASLNGSSTVDFSTKDLRFYNTSSSINSIGRINHLQFAKYYDIATTTVIATFTFGATSGGIFDITAFGFKDTVGTSHNATKIKVYRGTGDIATATSDTWFFGADATALIKINATSQNTAQLVLYGTPGAGFSWDVAVRFQGRMTSAEWR